MPHYALVVAQRIAESVAVARSTVLHPRAEKQMKAYKVTLPKRKAAGLDCFLQANGVTLSSFVEAYVDAVTRQHDEGRNEFPVITEATKQARRIDARRRSRAFDDA